MASNTERKRAAKNAKSVFEKAGMQIEMIPVTSIKKNPNNPRKIKKKDFDKLTKSILDFPEMMQIRPLVIDQDYMILGGNMRFEACKQLSWKMIPCIQVTLNEDQKRALIIKDNIPFGEWDYDILANEWDLKELLDWGLDLPAWDKGEQSKLDESQTWFLNIEFRDEKECEQMFNKFVEEGYSVKIVR